MSQSQTVEPAKASVKDLVQIVVAALTVVAVVYGADYASQQTVAKRTLDPYAEIFDARYLLKHGAFDFYKKGTTVFLAKTPCTEADVKPRFILKILKPGPDGRIASINKDFDFDKNGGEVIPIRELCVIRLVVPEEYKGASLEIGQAEGGRTLWIETIPL